MMSDDLENWVYSQYGREFYQPGLDRIGSAISDLKIKLQASKIITIAGTNGKGETTHRLCHLLQTSSHCTWTSPHIHSITERFSSERGNISIEELQVLLDDTHEIVQEKKFQLTYYEFLFFAFCRWASKKGPEFLLLEVGLGGRLDAVNVLDANVVLLTSISRDHQEYLGNRYDQILNEKLGVLKVGACLISYLDLKYLRERAHARALSLGAEYVDLEEYNSIPSYNFSLRNQFLAYAASCQIQGAPIDPLEWAPSDLSLSSRGEVIQSRNEWWLFGSHNVDGMRKLIQFLHSANYNSKDSPFRATLTSFSKRNEKDVRTMLKMLKACGLGEVIVTAFDHPKAYPREELEKLALQEGLKFVNDLSAYVQGWTHQKILVAGSYYFLGKLQPLFSGR